MRGASVLARAGQLESGEQGCARDRSIRRPRDPSAIAGFQSAPSTN
jgi:hypothetical protein